MKRSTWLQLCFIGSILAVGAAITTRLVTHPEAKMGDTFVLISPIFFTMAATKGHRFPKAAVAIGTLGLVFAIGALVAVWPKA